MTSDAVLCRSCGASVEMVALEGRAACRYCGVVTPLDAAALVRVRRHVCRLRRNEQKLRTILREGIKLHLVVPTASTAFLVAVTALLAAGFIGFALLVPDMSAAMVALGVLSMFCGLPLVIVADVRRVRAAQRKLPALVRAAEARVQTSASSRCATCGGHAAVPVLGAVFSAPCPWCGAALVGGGRDPMRAALEALTAEHRASTDRTLRRLRLAGGVPGDLTRSGGVTSFACAGADVWLKLDTVGPLPVLRAEVDCDTRLPGSVWFVRRELAEAHAVVARDLGICYPGPAQSSDDAVDASWVVYADFPVAPVVARGRIRAALEVLEESEALHLDPAGASLWQVWRSPAWGSAMVVDLTGRVEANSVERAESLAALVAGL